MEAQAEAVGVVERVREGVGEREAAGEKEAAGLALPDAVTEAELET